LGNALLEFDSFVSFANFCSNPVPRIHDERHRVE
jgi:hypothetical protein